MMARWRTARNATVRLLVRSPLPRGEWPTSAIQFARRQVRLALVTSQDTRLAMASRATLTGTVSFAPLAHSITATGQVRLFAPNRSGAGKLLAYDLPFSHEGREYFLTGRKFVGGGAPWRMWTETTTLHTRLHLGADESGPVVAAGVLRISALGLLQTLTTFRGAGMLDYGRFFATELWDSYGIHAARPNARS